MDQTLDKSPAGAPLRAPDGCLPGHGRAGAGRAGARPGRAARPAGAAAHCRRRQRGTLPAGDLGRFRPPLGRRDHHRRDDAGVLRDPACDQAPEELDGAAARGHRAAIPARAQPADPAAARRRRHHRALELSAPAHACARDRRDRRRQPCHHQAERTLAALLSAAEGDGGREIRCHRATGAPASRTKSQKPSHTSPSTISSSPARPGSAGWSRRPPGAISRP